MQKKPHESTTSTTICNESLEVSKAFPSVQSHATNSRDHHGERKRTIRSTKPNVENHGNFTDHGVKINGKDVIPPTSARRISIAMAAAGVILMAPLAGLFSQISGRPDFCEVACSPTSALCTEMERRGYVTKCYNYKNGYALERPIGTKMFNQDVKMHPPRTMWVLLPCTRLTSLVNLTERSPEEWAHFEKRQQQDLRHADDFAGSVIKTVENGGQQVQRKAGIPEPLESSEKDAQDEQAIALVHS
jgi:hypothetical protein